MKLWSRLRSWLRKFIQAKDWDQYLVEPIVPACKDPMSYCSSLRVRDPATGIVHIKDLTMRRLALCGQGFAASTLQLDVSRSTMPTCVFCVADMFACLPYWYLLPPDNTYRRVIEEGGGGR